MSTERKATAFHEAGHCLVAERLGYTVTKAWIEPEDDKCGEYNLTWFSCLWPALKFYFLGKSDHTMIISAGNATQNRFYPGTTPSTRDIKQLDDLRHYHLIYDEIVMQKLQICLSNKRNQDAIEKIAEILDRDGNITGQKVREVIAEIDSFSE